MFTELFSTDYGTLTFLKHLQDQMQDNTCSNTTARKLGGRHKVVLRQF